MGAISGRAQVRSGRLGGLQQDVARQNSLVMVCDKEKKKEEKGAAVRGN